MNDTIANFMAVVEQINERFVQLYAYSNDELREAFTKVATIISNSTSAELALNENLVEVYAIIKETARRFSQGEVIVTANANDIELAKENEFVSIQGDKAHYKNKWDVGGLVLQWNMVPYDEQILGGILLHYGYAAEMATGEGKTLVSIFPIALNALSHKGVHLMTSNDYLSKRDFYTNRPIYLFHGLTVDCIELHQRGPKRKKAYQADITFGTNSSFTFDYLFDHLATHPQECVQRQHSYAIIDELDAILIDEAQTPHRVGGGNIYNQGKIYKEHYPLVLDMVSCEQHVSLFTANALDKQVELTPKGEEWLAQKIGIPDLFAVKRLYEIPNLQDLSKEEQQNIARKLEMQNVLVNLLSALTIYEKDVDYVVVDDYIKIIDDCTGRIKESNRWHHGLHTAVEVKENVKVKDDFDSEAVISLKNYFKLYDKIAGMSGTIMSAQQELSEAYGLKCASLPTHKPRIRKDEPLQVFHTTEEKDAEVIKLVTSNHKAGRPSLICCLSIKRSEHIAKLLDEESLPFNRLDARTTKGEAELVAKAGLGNTITLATNVAGRGTDIKPSKDALDNGGLMVIGTDLFESIRIDDQLKGRSGRQGNPGSSIFFASLQDDILRFLSDEERIELTKIGETSKSSRALSLKARAYFEIAQRKAEAKSQKNRQSIMLTDDTMAPWREKYYKLRHNLLHDVAVVENFLSSPENPISSYKSLIDKHLEEIEEKVRILVARMLRNNPHKNEVLVPLSANGVPFAIRLEVPLEGKNSNYLNEEFKRQVVLQVYDAKWRNFVVYAMGNLDRHEINLLGQEYDKILASVYDQIILSLTQSDLLCDIRQMEETEHSSQNKVPQCPKEKKLFDTNALCPCGSGKKFYECHGNNIRRTNMHRRRR